MCITKKEAKEKLLVWADWMNRHDGASACASLGYSSDGKMSPDYVATAGCRGSGVKKDDRVLDIPEEVAAVVVAIAKLDKEYQAYANIFFRWKLRNRATIGDCVENYKNEFGLTKRQYERVSTAFYLKICALLG